MAKTLQDCIVLFGDSLTERQDVSQSLFERMNSELLFHDFSDLIWNNELIGDEGEGAYGRKLDVLNRGLGGYSSTLALSIFDQIFARKGEPSPTVRLVTLFFGTNDSVHVPNPRATPPDVFKSNTVHFLHLLTSPDSPYAVSTTPVHIVLITPPPPYLEQVSIPAKWLRSPERTLKFVQAVREVGEEWKAKEMSEENKTGWKVEVLDLWAEMEKRAGGLSDGLAPFFHDGCHMTTAGYGVLWDLYENLIAGKWKGRGLDWKDEADLPMKFPWWGHIDQDRLDESFRG